MGIPFGIAGTLPGHSLGQPSGYPYTGSQVLTLSVTTISPSNHLTKVSGYLCGYLTTLSTATFK